MDEFKERVVEALERIADAKEKNLKLIEESVEQTRNYQEKALKLDIKKEMNLQNILLNSLFDIELNEQED